HRARRRHRARGRDDAAAGRGRARGGPRARAHPRLGDVPLPTGAVLRRRAVRRVHRPHRLARRRPRGVAGRPVPGVPAPPRRHARAAGARPGDDDRRRARHQPVPGRAFSRAGAAAAPRPAPRPQAPGAGHRLGAGHRVEAARPVTKEAGYAVIRSHEAGSPRRGPGGGGGGPGGGGGGGPGRGGAGLSGTAGARGGGGVDRPEPGLRAEFCIRVSGEVRERPPGNENPDLPTGQIEVVADDLEVLAESEPLPFPVEGTGELSEDVRLRYRYLDIRRPEMAGALRLRSEASYLAGDVMREHGFVYVETPDLTRSTPEGARDFVVPVRLRPGSWYALPQSPQLFKQLLMVGGMERYYQLARCFRDEDFRADRQPEFTQIDIEMSFVTREDVIAVAEDLVERLWADLAGHRVPRPIPRMTYAEGMRRFGSDKPDLRFGCELAELTGHFAQTSFRGFRAPQVGAVVMPGGAGQSRRELDGWQEWARSRGARGLAYVLIGPDGAVSDSGPVARHLSDAERAGLAQAAGAAPGDCVFFAAGPPAPARALLGAARVEIGQRLGLSDPAGGSFLWVVDAPMFEDDGEGGWTAVHHPFTAPLPEWADKFAVEPDKALADAYDLVLNGVEIGGGSLRI